MITTEELRLAIKADVSEAVANLKKYDRQTSDSSSSTSKLSKVFAGMRDVMQGPVAAIKMGAAAFKQIAQEVDKLIMSAFEAEKVQAILNTTIASTGAYAWTSAQRLNDYAESMSKITLFDDEAITGMQGILLGFRNITGINFDKASTEILNMSQVMGMDLTSAAQAVGKALDSPVKGMDSLSKQGFKFSASEKALIKELVETNRLADAQDIILKELSKTYGGAATAAANTATGAYVNMKKAFGELLDEFGKMAASSGQWEKFGKFINELTGNLAKFNETKSLKNKIQELSELGAMSRFLYTTTDNQRSMLAQIGVDAEDAAAAVAYLENEIKLNTRSINAVGGDKAPPGFVDDVKKLRAANAELEKQLAIMVKVVPILNKVEKSKPVSTTAVATTPGDTSKPKTQEEWDKEFNAWLENEVKRIEKQVEMDRELEDAGLAAEKAFQDGKIKLDDEAMKKRIENAEKAAKAQEEAYKTVKDAAFNTWDSINSLIENNNDIYLKNLEEQGASEEELKSEKNRLGMQEFNSKKLTSIANIAIATAEGVMNAMKTPMPMGGILAGVVTAAGAVQAGIVGAQQYVPMAEGGSGIVTKPTLFLAGEAGPEPFAFGGANNKRGMNMGTTNTFVFNGSPFAIKDAEAVVYSAMAKANRGY